ncbi:efflux RND transporter periplasmic adaptor subunit [Nodosilinea sp. E11]|uniref:efflux RND transporter periplasmic adaptor subunit n=1 Tax=Nodosilinea sp. E11 TaxID=3037479 RepID=UPI0029345DB2|nr:efflux RND transporter periplasmic adaptor subunit [Nodosilinea sp. E11]WOD39664.1 efflux RND transporter periplasmic adaptor subunit [Nodosilinea sp. E11]
MVSQPYPSDATAPDSTKLDSPPLATAESPGSAPPDSRPASSPASTPNRQSRLRRFWWLIPLVGVVFTVGGISVVRLRDAASEAAVVAAPAPLTVQTVTAERGSIQAWVSSEGTVQAVRFKHLAFDVDGDITYLASREGRTLRAGDAVRQGELLAQIDDRTLQADINQAEAQVNEAQRQRGAATANVAQMESQVASARAQVAQAEAQVAQAQTAQNLAQTELQRYQQLFSQGAISASDLDNRRGTVQDAGSQAAAAQAQVQTAQAQVSTAQAQVQSAREQLRATDSQIATAQARLNQAQVTLEGTRLYAPFDGIVAYLNIRENEYYSLQAVSSQLGNYQELLSRVPIVVIDPSEFEVVADLSAGVGDRIQPGQTALVTASNGTALTQSQAGGSLIDSAQAQGSIFAVNPAVSPGNRAIQATARMTSGSGNLQHGASVNLWIAAAEQGDTVVVPLNAIAFRDQGAYVFVVNEATSTVEQRPVELGLEGFDQREVLSGLQAGEQIVTVGQNGLADGATVRVVGDRATQGGL